MKKRWPGLVALALLLAFAGAVAYINWNSNSAARFPLMEEETQNQWAQQSSDDALKQTEKMLALSAMRPIAEEKGVQLLFNDATCETALLTADGAAYRSNPAGRLAFQKTAAARTASQIVVGIINRDEVASSYYSFTDAVQYGQFRVSDLPKGVRVEYMMGKLTKTPLYPQALTVERYNEVYNQLAAKDQRKFKTYYSLADFSTLTDSAARETLLTNYANIEALGQIYVFKSSPTSLIVKNNLAYFASIGYTMADLAADHELVGYQAPAAGSNNVYLPVEYTLENGALQVKICLDEMQITGDIRVESVYVLPYFETAHPEKMEAVVTAGSGGIIPLTGSFSSATPVYREQLYGANFARHAPLSTSEKPVSFLPLLGFSDGESACYAWARQGAGDMQVRIEPPTGGSAVAAAGFHITVLEYASIRMDAESVKTVNAYADQAVLAPCVISYHPLPQGQAGWLAIANAFRQQLIAEGLLKEQPSLSPGAIITLVGAADDTGLLLGFPREVALPLTTYAQAEEILAAMRSALPHAALSFRLEGWAEGGVRSPAMAALSPHPALGGKEGLQSLTALANELQISLYPDADIQHVYRDGLMDGFSLAEDAARNVISETAARTAFSGASFQRKNDAPWGLAVNPRALPGQGRQALSKARALGFTALSLPYAGMEANSDYARDRFASRSEGVAALEETLRLLSAEQNLLMGGANLYALPYSAAVTEIPLSTLAHPLMRQTVPFTQAVLAGCMPLGAEKWNTAPSLQDYFLRCIEMGALPSGDLMYAMPDALKGTGYSEYMNLSYPAMKEKLTAGIAKVTQALLPFYGQPMADYQQPAPGVALVMYENGRGVCVNYNDVPYPLEDGRTVAPKDYLPITKGGGTP